MNAVRPQAMANRSRCTLAAALLAATLATAGCSADATRTGSTAAPPTSPPAPVGTTALTPPAKRPPHRRGRPRRRHPAPPTNPRSGSLAYSTASNDVVQPQPAPGSCHAIGSGLYSRPDPRCTPGALNPAVTQATIDQTICVEGWTDTVRPPESVTEQEKAASMAAYGDTGSMSDYEYDHFVPLELGGATNDPRNLWPEPGASPNPKDAVEDELRQEVCDGQMTLRPGAARDRHQLGSARPTRPAIRAERPDRPVAARPRAPSARSPPRTARLRRLRRLRPLQPARSDGDGHRRRRPFGQLAHRRLRLRRRLLQVGRLRARGGGSPHASARPPARRRSEAPTDGSCYAAATNRSKRVCNRPGSGRSAGRRGTAIGLP